MFLLTGIRNALCRFRKEESGQSLVLVVLGMVVIMGCAALGIDTGKVHNEQIKVQDATDIAALAAVKGLPTYGLACKYAEEYAGYNCDDLDVQVEMIGSDTVKVTCTKTVPNAFGKVIGNDSTTITCTATAKKVTTGGGAAPPEADCYYITTARFHQWPEGSRRTYRMQIDAKHKASHTTNRQTVVLCFNYPVYFVSGEGTYTGGNGTCMLTIDYSRFHNGNDNLGLGSVEVRCDGDPMDLQITSAVTLCEHGKVWPFVAGESAGAGSESAKIIG